MEFSGPGQVIPPFYMTWSIPNLADQLSSIERLGFIFGGKTRAVVLTKHFHIADAIYMIDTLPSK